MAVLTHFMERNMFRIEHNVETGEITQIDLTPEEIAEIEAIQAQSQAEQAAAQAARQAEAEAAAAAKAALLTKLGITEEEAKLLLS